jgi:hypothetical protein
MGSFVSRNFHKILNDKIKKDKVGNPWERRAMNFDFVLENMKSRYELENLAGKY